MGQIDRTDNFRADSTVSTGSASLADYKGSGYDRGHLAPAADMKFSDSAMRESFFMSNMSPQDPSFNRGIWKKLEAIVRQYAYDHQNIFIATGPVLNKESFPTIGPNQVSIPEYYYKVILDYREPEIKAIGFYIPNEKGSSPIEAYAVPIDVIEGLTGINFFSQLPDDVEEILESDFDISLWGVQQFNSGNISAATQDNSNKQVNVQLPEAAETFWINSNSNTRHNSGCRYYENTKSGYLTNDLIGTACKTCGG